MIKKIIFFFLSLSIIVTILFSDNADIPKNSPYYKTYKRGRDFFEKKQYDKAIDEFKKLIKDKPDFPQPYLNIAMIYEVNRNYGKAIEYYVKYLERGGVKLEKVKKSIKNIAHLKYLTNSDAEFKKLKKGNEYYIEGVKLAKKKKYSSAVKKFEESLKIISYYVKVHYAAGIAFKNEEKYLKAYEHFMKVLKYDPDNPDFVETYYYLGLFHDDLLIKDYDVALKFYKVYKEKNGSRNVEKFIKPIEEVNNLMVEAIRKFQENQKEEAIRLLKNAREIKPYDVRIYNNIAAIYINLSKFELAEKNLKKALEIKKEVGDTYYNFACLYSKKGDMDRSLEYFKKGMKYFSDETLKKSLKDYDLRNLWKNKEFKKLVMSRFQ